MRSPNPTTSSRAHLRYAFELRIIQPSPFYNLVSLFISGVTPQTPKCRRHLLKNQKYYGILVVAFSKGNLPNTFGVRRAPSKPAPVISVVKNPASNSHFTKQDKTAAIIQFLSLFSYGDSPPGYSSKILRRAPRPPHPQQNGNNAQIAAAAWQAPKSIIWTTQ